MGLIGHMARSLAGGVFRRYLSGWMALVCWQAEGAQRGFCAPSGAVAGRFMELRGAYSRSSGGMKRVFPAKVEEGLQCAVWRVLGAGAGGDEGSAGQRQLACALGWLRKRSEAESSALVGEV